MMQRCMCLLIVLILVGCRQPETPAATAVAAATATPGDPPRISAISASSDSVAQYERIDLTFQVATAAANWQLPYDASPPLGVAPGVGVSVDAHFTPDNWQTVFIQPAFFYQDFLSEDRNGRQWLYPTAASAWQVRFTPHLPGDWHYRLVVQDGNGRYQTAAAPFTVTAADSPGFVRVSQADGRYFEWSNGDYFPGLGMNLEIGNGTEQFAQLSANGVQLIRTYLPSQFGIWGAAWSPWQRVGAVPVGQESNARLRHDAAPPFRLTAADPPIAVPGSELFLWLSHDETVFDDGNQWRFLPCAVFGWNVPPIPVQPHTAYRLRVRYRTQDLAGPEVAERPFGFTVKTANWLWSRDDESQRCTALGAGTLLAASYHGAGWHSYPDPDNDGWHILQANLTSGDESFMPRLWLALENVTSGDAFIDQVWLEEVLDNGRFGPNVVYKAWMANHLYFDQRSSFAFDQALAAAEAYDIYLKLVLMEKQDYALNAFEADGSLTSRDPTRLGGELFLATGKTRWLQQAWWRYVQARWGYATHIHSWELLNEGSPTSEAHFALADEMGRYFQEAFIPAGQATPHPNTHLVTTSFWSGFPSQFWGADAYPHIDYADVHHYARPGETAVFEQILTPADYFDAAAFSQKLSVALSADLQTRRVMPLVRGEIGFLFAENNLFAQNVTDGLWLHNLLWAGLNAGGMMELYWTGAPTDTHIMGDGYSHLAEYRSFYNFVSTLPLNNGRYQDAAAHTSTPDLRAWGQKDVAANRAHLWLQNAAHTWGNVAQGVATTAVSGTVRLDGFTPNTPLTVTWWDTSQPDAAQQIIRSQIVTSDASGSLTLVVDGLVGDTAVQVGER